MVPISLCIITKNESAKLKRCLECAKDYPFEIIVVDTGSTDDSVAVAKCFTNNVYHFKWIQDFSAARNFSISKASNDWILVLDTDEYIKEINLEAIYELIEANPQGIGRLLRISYDSHNNVMQDRVERLFNKNCYAYSRPIHEQVTPIHETPYSLFLIPLVCEHDGYVETLQNAGDKARRDLKILLDNLTQYNDSYSYYQIGQCYYILEDYKTAINYYEKGLSFDLDPHSEYVQIMVVNYAKCLLLTEQIQKAHDFYKSIYHLFDTFADFVFLNGQINYLLENYIQAGLDFLKATSLTDFKLEGCNSYRAYYHLGLIYAKMGDYQLSKKFFLKCGNYTPAKQALSKLQQDT